MTYKSKEMDPYLADQGDMIIAITGGESRGHIVITDEKEIAELRFMMKWREEIGRAISKKLADHGMK